MSLNTNEAFIYLKESKKYPWLVDFIQRWDEQLQKVSNDENWQHILDEYDVMDALVYEAAYKDKLK